MAAIFSPRATPLARAACVFILLAFIAVPSFAMVWVRTPYARGQGRFITQPIPFDHRVHVNGLRIDCLYCHAGAERTANAGVPTTQQCVDCHCNQWLASESFSPVRKSMETGEPIPWKRVNQVPDFVYFNHAMHVSKKVACETCHGEVSAMPMVTQAKPLTMAWCVDCHRQAEKAITISNGPRSLTNCSTCHR